MTPGGTETAHPVEVAPGSGRGRWRAEAYLGSVPSWRATKDVSIKDDLVEEVGRMVGYASIPPVAPLTPATVPEGGPASSVSVTVTDVSTGTKSSPTGTVTFSSSYPGDTFSSMTCGLAPTGADKSGCSVSVTGGDNGAHTITATYSGSAVHETSSGTNTLTVTNVAPTVGLITATPSGPR